MRVVQFGTYVFPAGNKADDTSVGDSSGYVMQLPGGYTYDAYGTGVAHERLRRVTVDFEITETTTALMQTARDAIRNFRGMYTQLAVELYDTSLRWQWARLTDIQFRRTPRDVYVQPVRCTFEIKDPGWRGNKFDTTFVLDEISTGFPTQTIQFENNGNRTVTDPIVQITAGSSQVASVQITSGSCDWAFWKAIPAGQSLVVDCGARTVHLNGVDTYINFELQPTHATGNWLEIIEGSNFVTVNAVTSASDATIQIIFYDGWE